MKIEFDLSGTEFAPHRDTLASWFTFAAQDLKRADRYESARVRLLVLMAEQLRAGAT